MKFETDNQEIIELYKIYNFFKYYHQNVITDIYSSIKNFTYSYLELEQIIMNMLNKQELETFKKYCDIITNEYNIYLQFPIIKMIISNFKPHKIVKKIILYKLKQLDNLDNLDRIFLYTDINKNFLLYFKQIYDPKNKFSLSEYIKFYQVRTHNSKMYLEQKPTENQMKLYNSLALDVNLKFDVIKTILNVNK